MYSRNKPEYEDGDCGGNDVPVKTKEGKLHSYWDGLLIHNQDFAQKQNEANILITT